MKTWGYGINPFITATRYSQRSMKKICNFTINTLKAAPDDAFLASLLTTLQPYANEYNHSFSVWFSNQANQLSKSASLTDLLHTLSKPTIRDWDIDIQVVYHDDTPEYIKLLPHNRAPFQTGSQLDRMNAVTALSISIDDDVKLQTVKTSVDAFDLLLKNAYQVQKSSIAGTGNGSDDLETNRIVVAEELYSVLGLLMSHYKKTPEKVANFFDMETIRNHQQSIFKAAIAEGATVLGLTHTFDVDEEMIFINRGKTNLRIALLPDANSDFGLKFITIPANSKLLVKLQDLGDIATCRFLKIQNMDANLAGAYTIELL